MTENSKNAVIAVLSHLHSSDVGCYASARLKVVVPYRGLSPDRSSRNPRIPRLITSARHNLRKPKQNALLTRQIGSVQFSSEALLARTWLGPLR